MEKSLLPQNVYKAILIEIALLTVKHNTGNHFKSFY